MDARVTLQNKESFLQILKKLHANAEKVSLLYDLGGLTRYEGLISGITNAPVPSLLLQEGKEIPVASVIAVNGIFVPEYSEC